MPKITTQISHSKQSTRFSPLLRQITRFSPPLLCAFLTACSTPSTSTPSKPNAPIAAIVNGQPITTTDLYPLLAETAGKQILDERILTHLLDTIATDQNWSISDPDIQIELDALITTIDQSTDPQSTPRLIQTIRRRRGLGPTRFNALLRRNAILRRMVSADPTIDNRIRSEIQRAQDQLSSPPTPEQSQQIAHRSTLVAQQLAMESLARSLVDDAEVLIMDRSIKWSGE